MAKRIIETTVCALVLSFSAAAADSVISGAWKGELKLTAVNSLKLVFHFSKDASGQPSFTLDSPQQGAFDIPGTINYISADSINVSVASIGMNYSGKKTGEEINGIFRQGIASLPLSLSPDVKELNRPQAPKPPFSYSTKEVKIPSTNGTVLAATITLPKAYSKKTPAVVLVSGSGLQNRDEELFGHKPFAVIADYLANNGIASIRYDDRGYGESTGDASGATTADFAEDAKAAADYMRKAEHFSKVGILGHSEGANIAFMLGAKKDADFIVAVGAAAVRGDSILASQSREMLVQYGMPQNIAEDYTAALYRVYDAKINKGREAATAEAKDIARNWSANPMMKQLSSNLEQIALLDNPWMNYFIKKSPAPDISATKCPVLVIYGEKDTQVIPSVNKPVMKRLARKAEIMEYKSLNHLMQHAVRGTVDEYAEIEETFSAEVLADIVRFILAI